MISLDTLKKIIDFHYSDRKQNLPIQNPITSSDDPISINHHNLRLDPFLESSRCEGRS